MTLHERNGARIRSSIFETLQIDLPALPCASRNIARRTAVIIFFSDFPILDILAPATRIPSWIESSLAQYEAMSPRGQHQNVVYLIDFVTIGMLRVVIEPEKDIAAILVRSS